MQEEYCKRCPEGKCWARDMIRFYSNPEEFDYLEPLSPCWICNYNL